MRRSHGTAVIISTVLIAVASIGSADATVVSDFKSGLVCDPGKAHAWICHQAEDIHLTGQGRCVYDGEQYPCTWYGFSFNYANNIPGTQLECEYTSTLPRDMGNPEGVVARNTATGKYSLTLDHVEGRVFNPQYTIFGVRTPEDDGLDSTTTTCSISGQEIATFEFNLLVPLIPVD